MRSSLTEPLGARAGADTHRQTPQHVKAGYFLSRWGWVGLGAGVGPKAPGREVDGLGERSLSWRGWRAALRLLLMKPLGAGGHSVWVGPGITRQGPWPPPTRSGPRAPGEGPCADGPSGSGVREQRSGRPLGGLRSPGPSTLSRGLPAPHSQVPRVWGWGGEGCSPQCPGSLGPSGAVRPPSGLAGSGLARGHLCTSKAGQQGAGTGPPRHSLWWALPRGSLSATEARSTVQ